MSKKIILDCDPGMDDSMAIVMAAKSSELELLAVTAVNGNYPVSVTVKNALKVLEMLKKDNIPVARGMAVPMVRKSPSDPFTHGGDGQAENNLPAPVRREDSRHAVNLIAELVKANPGEVTLISTGPMSNIAMAFRMYPEIISLVKEVIAISGAFGINEYAFLNATGDTPQSEWNVYVDPEAASIVYESGVKLTLIGLDVATYFNVDFSKKDIEDFDASSNPEARFLSKAIRFVKGRGYGAYCTCIDCMAVAYAIDESLVKTKEARVGISREPGIAYGMTVRDGRAHHGWTDLPLVDIAEEADYSGFLALLKKLVLA
jgi:Inosine-uridine nucleoside N-ribohydrolase